jgi:hypothetical protein
MPDMHQFLPAAVVAAALASQAASAARMTRRDPAPDAPEARCGPPLHSRPQRHRPRSAAA